MDGQAGCRGQQDAAPILVVTGMAFEAALAAGPGVETMHGLRGAALADALAARLIRPCRGVLSFGVAGGLDPALVAGAVVVADDVVVADPAAGRGAMSDHAPTASGWTLALRAALPEARGGSLAGSDSAVATVARKAALRRSTGAVAVDMESHLAVVAAARAGVPLAVCRVIVDPAGCAVPPAALAALGQGGGIDVLGLLRALASRPGDLPALLALARAAAAARRALRDVRRRAGTAFAVDAADSADAAGSAGSAGSADVRGSPLRAG